MSLIFPNYFTAGAKPGTNAISLKTLKSSLSQWTENDTASPTYEAWNTTTAYIEFYQTIKDFKTDEFVNNPDEERFKYLRKYLILMANIILAEYNSVDIRAREFDYKTVCNYDNKNSDLVKLAGDMAKAMEEETDPSKTVDVITEICVQVDDRNGVISLPIAFYAYRNSTMRIYPRNMIDDRVLEKLFGWDTVQHDFTMASLKKFLDSNSLAPLALYYAMQQNNLAGNVYTQFLSLWLTGLYPDVTNASKKIIFDYHPIRFIDSMAAKTPLTSIQIPEIPDIGGIELFSEQLLLINSNTNFNSEDGKAGIFGYCKLNNRDSLGLGNKIPNDIIVVPPMSQQLVQRINQLNGSTRLDSCEVRKHDKTGGYEVTLYLKINSSAVPFPFRKIYDENHVQKCYNFPIITMVSDKDEHQDCQLFPYRTNYPVKYEGFTIDGREFIFSDPTDAQSLPIFTSGKVTQGYLSARDINNGSDKFAYLYVGYHDDDNIMHNCGYLIFDPAVKSIRSMALSAQKTEVIIDTINDVAQIAMYDNATQQIKCCNVYNDTLLKIQHNNRDDIRDCMWGDEDTTIFRTAVGNPFVVAPFSENFAELVANNKLQIIPKGNGTNLTEDTNSCSYSVSFTVNGVRKDAAKKVYTKENIVTIPNPPFLRTIHGKGTRPGDNTIVPGYYLVRVNNMNPAELKQPGNVEANELEFRYNDTLLDTNPVFIPGQPTNGKFYIRIYNGNTYYGQISLDVNRFDMADGFTGLTDNITHATAIMLVKSDPSDPERRTVVTSNVFNDNLLLIAEEDSSIRVNYKAWTATNQVVNVSVTQRPNLAPYKMEGYQAVFPFSEDMLRNINEHNLMLVPDSMSVDYNEATRKYVVSVRIQDNSGNASSFSRDYESDKGVVVKCENLPFMLSMRTGNNSLCLARFNNHLNEDVEAGVDCIDGSKCVIECLGQNRQVLPIKEINANTNHTLAEIEDVPNSQKLLLRLSCSYMASSQEGNISTQFSCYMLYNVANSLEEGLYSVQSEKTGRQYLIDCIPYQKRAEKIDIFTEYIMWTDCGETDEGVRFAHDTLLTPAQKNGFRNKSKKTVSHIYSVPVTIAFTKLLEERHAEIKDYGRVSFYTDKNNPNAGIQDDTADLYVKIRLDNLRSLGPSEFVKKYSADKIQKFDFFILPALTVFPYVDFVADNDYGSVKKGDSLWKNYFYAKFTEFDNTQEKAQQRRSEGYGDPNSPLGSRVDFYIKGKKLDFQPRSTKPMDHQAEVNRCEIMLATSDIWGRYIHMVYNGKNGTGPDIGLDGKEFGCIIMKNPTRCAVNYATDAKVGVDFGTRNSIIALKPAVGGVSYPYHGEEELQSTIIPGIPKKNFVMTSNLCYIPEFYNEKYGKGCGKFSSMVMTYTHVISANQEVNPYEDGFVPNVEGAVLDKIMGLMDADGGNMGDVIGLYSDLKITNDPANKAIMERNVKTFIKSIILHTVLNCYRKHCGDIHIRFSVPAPSYAKQLGNVWAEAKDYILRFLPEGMESTITIDGYETEANALFTFEKDKPGAKPRFSVITDGGDGTYDFTINDEQEFKVKHEPADSFSLRYAGQQIMTSSILAFFRHLIVKSHGIFDANAKNIFMKMWNQSNRNANSKTLEGLVDSLHHYHNTSFETAKTLILTMIEQYGINYDEIFNMAVVHAGDAENAVKPEYVNFVRMIQFKLLFLFNVLGEKIRNTLTFSSLDKSLTIYLYGGTAQAFTIAEPTCCGNLANIKGHVTDNRIMLKAIKTMMNLKADDRSEVTLLFIPAENTEKIEIASAMTTLTRLSDPSMIPAVKIPRTKSAGNSSLLDDEEEFEDYTLESLKPQSVEQFTDALSKMLQARYVPKTNPKTGETRNFPLDIMLPFISRQDSQKNIYLSGKTGILKNPIVLNAFHTQIGSIWSNVCNDNPDLLDKPQMIYNIFTLKMVDLAIETYLGSAEM